MKGKFAMAETDNGTPETPAERDIFRFHDGTKDRAADPMKIWFAMWADETIDLGTAIKRFESNELEAVQELISRARIWIGIPEFNEADGSGLTDLEFCRVWWQWLNFVVELKKKRGQLPMPLRVLERRPPGNPSTPKPDSDSSSTPSGSPSAEPTTTFSPSLEPSEAALGVPA